LTFGDHGSAEKDVEDVAESIVGHDGECVAEDIGERVEMGVEDDGGNRIRTW
jgi:hypothetical protein